MALKYVSSIDLNLNQLLNAVVQNLASAPTSGNKKGRVYFDTSANLPYWYNGSAWVTFASATDFSTLSGSVTTLQGYFTSGKANNADKLDGVSLEGLFTALSSDTTNAVSVTVGGVTKNIAVATLKTSLGLKALAYKDSFVASDIPDLDWSKITSGKPTTLSGYGITDAYTKMQVDNIAAKYLPLAGGTMTGTITFGTSGKSITAAGVANLAATTLDSLTVSGAASIGGTMTSNAVVTNQITIGKVVIKEDSDGVLKFYYSGDEAGETNTATIYATGGVSALGLGTGGTGGSGSGVNLLTSWTDEYDETYALSAELGLDLYNNKASKTYVTDAVSVVSGNLANTNARVSVLESYFSTAEDSDATINKWNEIVEFLDGIAEVDSEGKTLANLLASKVGSVEVTGSGNAVTAASISGGKLTLTKGATFADNTTAVKRFNSTLSGDGTTTSFTVTHSFNTKDVIVFVYEVSSPYQQVFVDIAMTSTTAITVTFASAPASGTNYKVVILA